MRRLISWPFLLPLAVAACSSSLGSEALDIPPEGVTAPISCSDVDDPRPASVCPGAPTISVDTARTTVELLLPLATAAYGSGARWAGTIQGAEILRTGRPSGLQASGWATAFCSESSALMFDVTAGACVARNLCDCLKGGTCGGAGCDPANDKPFPQIDSAQAIAAAFADDAIDVAYDLTFDVRTNQWLVTRRTDGNRKKIDGTTGAVIP